MAVSFYNFSRLNSPELRREALELFSKIMEDNAFIDGHFNRLFEEEFAKHQQAKHCLLVANGTDALEISLEALEVGVGDRVGIPGITFHATAEAVLNRGAEPVLIDVDPMTGLMSPDSLKRILKQVYLKAIIPVHIYGMPAPIAELEQICLPRHISIIEDGAQAHGTILADGRPAGSSNNLTTFSFYPTKNLGAFGDAGAILTQDDELAKKINSLRNHGRNSGPNGQGPEFFGRNSRCDHFQAAILHLKLRHLDAQNQRRREIAASYLQQLQKLFPEIGLPAQEFLSTSSWHLFPILLRNKEQKMHLKEYLDQHKIGNALFYERSLGNERPLVDCPGEGAKALQFADRVLCLPIHPTMTDEEIIEVVNTIKEGLCYIQ